MSVKDPEEEKLEQRRQNIMIVFVVSGFFILSAILLTLMWYKDNVQECASEPLVYGVKKLEKEYGANFFGMVYAKTEKNVFPFLSFNGTNTYKQ